MNAFLVYERFLLPVGSVARVEEGRNYGLFHSRSVSRRPMMRSPADFRQISKIESPLALH
jgi:hypothetical protein